MSTYTSNVVDADIYEDGYYLKGMKTKTYVKTIVGYGYYIGEMENGKYNGNGKFRWNTGETYDGEWRNGKPHGKGNYTCTNGNVSERRNGEVEHNFIHSERIDEDERIEEDERIDEDEWIDENIDVPEYFVNGLIKIMAIQPELEKEITNLDQELPFKEAIKSVLRLAIAKWKELNEDEMAAYKEEFKKKFKKECKVLWDAYKKEMDEYDKLLEDDEYDKLLEDDEKNALADDEIRKGLTPLMLACLDNRVDEVRSLLAEAPDTAFLQDENGFTALMFAARRGNIETVRLLLASHPETAKMTNNSGTTALDIASAQVASMEEWSALSRRCRNLRKKNKNKESRRLRREKREILVRALARLAEVRTEFRLLSAVSAWTESRSSSPAAELPSAPDDKLCVVCMDSEKSHLVVPCGHMCMCKGCSDSMISSRPSCPVCMGPMERVLKVFM